MSKRYYYVHNGDVYPANPCDDADYDNFLDAHNIFEGNAEYEMCTVYAEDEQDALRLADMSDRDEIQADNVWCQSCGHAHATISDNR